MKRVAVLAVLLACAACSKDKPAPTKTTSAPAKAAVAAPAQPKAPPRPAELQHVTIKALGMYCEESCPLKVRYALADNHAVYELGFDTANESIFVSYDRSLGTPKDVTRPMLKAIKDAGFDPWLAKETWPDDAQANVQVVLR
jgi:hypothetical protein